MINLLFAFLFVDELNYAKKAVYLSGLKIKDLGYEKRWKRKDSARLKIVDVLLKNPMKVPSFMEEFSSSVDDKDVSKVYRYMASLIRRKRFKSGNFSSFEDLVKIAKDFKNIFSSFSLSEMDTLLYNVSFLWTDEDDSLNHSYFSRKDSTYQLPLDQLIHLLFKIPMDKLLRSGYLVLRYENFLSRKYENYTNDSAFYIEGVKGRVLYYKSTSFGDIVIGSKEDNVYKKHFAIIIDMGGNDRYTVLPASGRLFDSIPISFIIDYAGDDYYCDTTPGALASGIFGIGIIEDFKGNDIYRGGPYSCGIGLVGLGFIIDHSGWDVYRGGFFSIAAGNFGVGYVKDMKGNDIYDIWDFGEGFGGPLGIGLLEDIEGNDTYIAGGKYAHEPLLPDQYKSFAQGFGMGWRDFVSGGIGFLLDRDGNDRYISEVFAQGTSYWFSFGGLYDEKGNDYYEAAQYAQGAGIHLSVGALIDGFGNDQYFAMRGPSQGEGHDLSVGWFIDHDGNDVYYVSGGEGLTLANSVSFFVDRRGKDNYSSRESMSRGGAKRARGFGGAGYFLDLEGDDFYAGGIGSNDSIWFSGDIGLGMDIEEIPPYEEKEYDTIAVLRDVDTLQGEKRLKRLFDYACMWEVGSAIGKVRTARKILVNEGVKAIKYMFKNRLNTYSGLALRAIIYLSKKIDKDSLRPFIVEGLKSHNDTIVKNCLYIISQIKDTLYKSELERLYKQDKFSFSAARTMADLKIKGSFAHIKPFLHDKNEVIRQIATAKLARINGNKVCRALFNQLDDKSFSVRQTAALTLAKKNCSIIKLIKMIEKHPQFIYVYALSNYDFKKVNDSLYERIFRVVKKLIYSKNPGIRYRAVIVLNKIKKGRELGVDFLYQRELPLNIRKEVK